MERGARCSYAHTILFTLNTPYIDQHLTTIRTPTLNTMNCFNFAFIFLSLQILSTISITYGQTCEDSTENFELTLDDGSQLTRSCYHAQKNPWGQCEKIEMKFNCPKSCSLCPGDIFCKVKIDLQFPQDESFAGYHSDFVHVQKEGQTEVCHSGNDKTMWGCTHIGGDAFIDGRAGQTFQKASSSVRIFDVRNAKLKVGVSHRFSEKEVLEEMEGGLGRANLIIKVNGQMQTQSFRHEKNANRHTHAGFDQVNALNRNVGFVDPTYIGDYFAHIACDNSCNCVIETKDAECRLSAQLKFPKIEETNYHGYHNDV